MRQSGGLYWFDKKWRPYDAPRMSDVPPGNYCRGCGQLVQCMENCLACYGILAKYATAPPRPIKKTPKRKPADAKAWRIFDNRCGLVDAKVASGGEPRMRFTNHNSETTVELGNRNAQRQQRNSCRKPHARSGAKTSRRG